MNRLKNFLPICFTLIIMVLYAMSSSVRGVLIPVFKEEFAIDNSRIGTLLFVCSMGGILATYIGGFLCEGYGQKKVIMIGQIIGISSLGLMLFVSSYTTLLISLFVLNFGNSLITVAINTLVPLLALSFQAALMNIVHFSFGLGATITQRATGFLLFQGIEWRHLYLAIGAMYVIALASLFFVKVPTVHSHKRKTPFSDTKAYHAKYVFLYIAALGMYLISELGIANWFVNYMSEIYSYNANESSFYLSLFFGMFTLGRLGGGFVAERVGYLKSVIISLSLAFILCLTGLLMGESGLIFISMSGMFFAIGYPTIVVTISQVFGVGSAAITAKIMTVSGAICIATISLMGFLNDYLGIYRTFFVIPISLALCSIITWFIHYETKSLRLHEPTLLAE